MKALLDTLTFLWWIEDPKSLSQTVRELILNGENEIFLSVASVWEIAIKAHKGRITLPDTVEKVIANALSHYHFSVLPIQVSHACQVALLPDYHSDPFDRLLIAQCQVEDMVLLSADKTISKYNLDIIWE